jgi:hypothetical protein
MQPKMPNLQLKKGIPLRRRQMLGNPKGDSGEKQGTPILCFRGRWTDEPLNNAPSKSIRDDQDVKLIPLPLSIWYVDAVDVHTLRL